MKTKNGVKIVTFQSIEAFLERNDVDWDSYWNGKLLVELADGSQWGPVWKHARPARGLQYLYFYEHHLERRHRSLFRLEDDDDIMFLARANRFDSTKLFCECCGWLDPLTDPEIAAPPVHGAPKEALAIGET